MADPKKILVIGGGFAGLWAAIGARRKLREQGVSDKDVQVSLINRDGWHNIRVRNYEADLAAVRVPLDRVLEPVAIELIIGEVTAIDIARKTVTLEPESHAPEIAYDRLVVAAGSRVNRPDLQGLADHAFDVDTRGAAAALNAHIADLGISPNRTGRDTAVVIGAGLTGIEIACELPDRMRDAGISDPRVILADRNPQIGSDMGDQARPVIQAALDDLGVMPRTGVGVAAVDGSGIDLADGGRIDAATVVWCAGMRANPLAELFPVDLDPLGRLPVDDTMRVIGVDDIFAAGDIAAAPISPGHSSVMSCQHGRPMGRHAGHNVAADLVSAPLLPLRIDWYVTCLDLGPAGAVYTEGWDRHVVATGAEAKETKTTINRDRIYPPRSFDADDILAAAEPVVQSPPIDLDSAEA